MKKPLFLALDEDDFRQLVQGKVVELKSGDGTVVKLILSDIGVLRMYLALCDAGLVAAGIVPPPMI